MRGRLAIVVLAVLVAGCGPGNGVGGKDAGPGDVGSGDGGSADAGGSSGDAGLIDAGPWDAGSGDAGLFDAGPGDAGLFDAGSPNDAGSPADAGSSADAGSGGNCTITPPAQVVIYTGAAWNVLADALAADPIPCGDYYLSIPAVTDPATGYKTWPRAGQAATMRARGPGFHAMAELHFASWSKVTTMTWYQKGVEFRRRMVTQGYDVTQGDTWAVNELPSTVRSSATTRQHVENLVRGLHDGPPGAPPVRGAVFVIGVGQGMVNFGPYKTNLESWLTDAPFWVEMNNDVRFFAPEVYADPNDVCVPNTTVGTRSAQTNYFVEHPARLATVGPNGANTAQSYFSQSYLPLMNAVWGSSGAGYGNTVIPLDQMEHFVSGEVYAARAWAGSHNYPDGRIGFAWTRTANATVADLTTLASRLATALHYAYRQGGTARYACSRTGAYTWCQCSLSGAVFNTGWQTAFSTW